MNSLWCAIVHRNSKYSRKENEQARKGFRPISANHNLFGIVWEFLESFFGIWGEFFGNLGEIFREFFRNSFGISWEWDFFGNENSLGMRILWEWEFFGNSLGILLDVWIAYWHKIVRVTWNDANFDLRRDGQGQQIKSLEALLRDRA